jgi:hydroxymethylglutaryl-CoA synthase
MHKKNNNTGIIGWGYYLPQYRITIDEIATHHQQDMLRIKNGLLLNKKTVPGKDEDSVTMAVQATKNALASTHIERNNIGAIYFGSESHPYTVKQSSVIVGQAISENHNYMAADLEFACKAGTSAMQLCYGLVKAKQISYGLAIGSDTAQARPGDILEYSAGAGAASIIIGNKKHEIVATIQASVSCASDTPDFWRRTLQKYPEHTSRFSITHAYIKHIVHATQTILKKTGLQPKDFDHVIFHQPNGKLPFLAAKILGFTKEQLKHGLMANNIGNCYSASSLIGLCNVLHNAKPHQTILLTSYGAGGGSDSFVFKTTDILSEKKVSSYNKSYKYLTYAQYKTHVEQP